MADHEHATIKHQDHLLLDQPLLRLPYELLRKNFRSAHFTVEKDSTAIKSLLKETATASVNGRASPDDVLRNLDTMINRMRGVKRKLAAHADEEARLTRQAGARISHLGDLYQMHSVEDVKYEAWSRARLDRLLVDYLLRHGYNESAKALTAERGMDDLVDVETFVQMSRIQEALRGGSVTEALGWCQDNKKELRKMDSNLEFMLRFQQYIELVRTQSQPKLLEAIAHAKKYLVPFKATYPDELRKAFGLLAYPPHAANAVYSDLYSQERWHSLADLFTRTHNNLLALPSFPLLHIALSSGLSALKTPACHSVSSSHVAPSDANTATNTSATAGTQSVCPICSTELNDLARNVPYAHHTKSYVDHDLLLLPNSRAYGKEKLEDYAKKSGLPAERVRDLRTGEVFPMDKLKKVFIT
ncbi:Protein FYV10 [Colletotrichum sidae]|uniref:Protein FYV10 n=3 Tax=Colletotrichum orbiculare species complex TaxID=2707354 RepID=N4UT91_COLOR|nr:Protein FYV10 [Colletotrichum orbiculare MAFF 240422]TDZ36325.1 Protein FYV10 [Colletotrichum spinosum]TEA21153.1 Protein FYV10 [Colletotrichum sidae]